MWIEGTNVFNVSDVGYELAEVKDDTHDVTLACDDGKRGRGDMKRSVNYWNFNALNVLKSFTKQTIWVNTKMTNIRRNYQKSKLSVMCVVNSLCLTGLWKTIASGCHEAAWFFRCDHFDISSSQKNVLWRHNTANLITHFLDENNPQNLLDYEMCDLS